MFLIFFHILYFILIKKLLHSCCYDDSEISPSIRKTVQLKKEITFYTLNKDYSTVTTWRTFFFIVVFFPGNFIRKKRKSRDKELLCKTLSIQTAQNFVQEMLFTDEGVFEIYYILKDSFKIPEKRMKSFSVWKLPAHF